MITRLANAYARTKRNEDFAALYEELAPSFRKRWLARNDVDPHDAETAFHSALWEIADTWTDRSLDFMKQMNTRYKMRLIDQIRRQPDRTREFSLDDMSQESEDRAAVLIADERENVEDNVIKKMIESGRQAVIDHLLHPVTSDNATTAIVAVLKVSPFESLTALGKAAGVHHEVVKRKLRAMACRYDRDRFGDIRDYFAV